MAEFDYEMGHCAGGAFEELRRRGVIHWLAKYILCEMAACENGLLVWASRSDIDFCGQVLLDSGVPIWHCDRLVHPTGALDIGLIRDEANIAAPRREPQVESSKIRGVDGHTTTNHPALDAKVVVESRLEWKREDGGYDGPGRSVNNRLGALRVLGDQPGH
ncbi:hypothetical protein H5410_040993 [Solanum commersonii]|uniref:Uncharacterized protein n=1 Tax=Solanum commersonii TaxID=4109 RepID=A0A9J5XSE6_SOLCO|nr:hypothetical protein H5410_040993 [Solanum commersonii]